MHSKKITLSLEHLTMIYLSLQREERHLSFSMNCASDADSYASLEDKVSTVRCLLPLLESAITSPSSDFVLSYEC